MRRQPSGCRGIERGKGQIETMYVAQIPGVYRVVLDNSFSAVLTKKITVGVDALIKLDEKSRVLFRQGFRDTFNEIRAYFNVVEFDFALTPCGKRNAYSMRNSGNIVFCSELFFDLLRQGLKGAIEGIFWHELGHSLLGLQGYQMPAAKKQPMNSQ
jgi:hypothetical protein